MDEFDIQVKHDGVKIIDMKKKDIAVIDDAVSYLKRKFL